MQLLRTNPLQYTRLPRPLRRGFSSVNRALATAPDTAAGAAFKRYGGVYTVTLMPGDGVGQEIASAVKTIFRAASIPVEFEQLDVTGDSASDHLMKQAIDSLRRTKVGLKGIFHTPVAQFGRRSFNVAMRKEMDIYASVSHVKGLTGCPVKYDGVDFVIIRENTEGEYSGLEHQSYPGVVESLKVVTREKTERIARFAFDFALRNGRKRVSCIHKANIMKLSDGLFLNICRRIAEDYKSSGITFNDLIVDNAAMQLVSKPQQFDVVVTGNLYGNIISNIGAGLVGGPGVVPGANMGDEFAVFEPGCRHVGKDIQGRNIANPSALILSSVLMLRHLKLDQHADRLNTALEKTIEQGGSRTPDMGGTASTTDFTLAVISNL